MALFLWFISCSLLKLDIVKILSMKSLI